MEKKSMARKRSIQTPATMAKARMGIRRQRLWQMMVENRPTSSARRFPWLTRWWWADPAYAYQPLTQKPEEELAAPEDCNKHLQTRK
jgi:hypothetical protein